MIGNANGVLRECGVVVAIGIGGRWSEVLQIIVGYAVSVSAQRHQRQPAFLRCKREGIHLDGVEDVFAVLLAGEIIVNPGNEGIASKFQGVAAAVEAECFGKLGAVFAGGARKQIGTSNAVED